MQSDSTSGHVASVETQNGNFRLDAVTVDEQGTSCAFYKWMCDCE